MRWLRRIRNRRIILQQLEVEGEGGDEVFLVAQAQNLAILPLLPHSTPTPQISTIQNLGLGITKASSLLFAMVSSVLRGHSQHHSPMSTTETYTTTHPFYAMI
jgi:hypothetical protein